MDRRPLITRMPLPDPRFAHSGWETPIYGGCVCRDCSSSRNACIAGRHLRRPDGGHARAQLAGQVRISPHALTARRQLVRARFVTNFRQPDCGVVHTAVHLPTYWKRSRGTHAQERASASERRGANGQDKRVSTMVCVLKYDKTHQLPTYAADQRDLPTVSHGIRYSLLIPNRICWPHEVRKSAWYMRGTRRRELVMEDGTWRAAQSMRWGTTRWVVLRGVSLQIKLPRLTVNE